MSCCLTYLNLGCVYSCGTLTLAYNAEETGTHTVIVHQGGNHRSFTFTGTSGQPISIDLSNFNESGVTIFEILNPSGSQFEVGDDDEAVSCFRIDVSILYTSTAQTTEEDSTCCDPTIIPVDDEQTYTLTLAQWSDYGAIPTIEVFYNDGGGYTTINVQPIYNTMPTPTTITITLPGIPTETWYIKLS